MQPYSVSFTGTYELRHAVRGLRLQLIPFAALALGLLAVTAASAPIGTGITILLSACFMTVVYFTAASYRRELNKMMSFELLKDRYLRGVLLQMLLVGLSRHS